MIKKMSDLLKEYWETFAYLFFGVLTVIFNIIAFLILNIFVEEIMANTIAFFIAVQFAYITNTKFVFQAPFTKENFLSFWGMRIGTLVIDNGGLWLLMYAGCDKLIAKCTVNVVIIVLNYIFSKFFIYKRKEDL